MNKAKAKEVTDLNFFSSSIFTGLQDFTFFTLKFATPRL
jgi:hypothetical protein